MLPTDGKMSDLVRSCKIDKDYYAQVDGLIDEAAIAQIQVGSKSVFTARTTSPVPASLADST